MGLKILYDEYCQHKEELRQSSVDLLAMNILTRVGKAVECVYMIVQWS